MFYLTSALNAIAIVVAKIELGGSCTTADVCKDVMAICNRGICSCMDGFRAMNDECGKSQSGSCRFLVDEFQPSNLVGQTSQKSADPF